MSSPILDMNHLTRLAIELFVEPMDTPLRDDMTEEEMEAAEEAHARKVFDRRAAGGAA